MNKTAMAGISLVLVVLLISIPLISAVTVSTATSIPITLGEKGALRELLRHRFFLLTGLIMFKIDHQAVDKPFVLWFHPLLAFRIGGGPIYHRHFLGPGNLWYIDASRFAGYGIIIPPKLLFSHGTDEYWLGIGSILFTGS